MKEILLGSSSPLCSTQLQNEDASHEHHAWHDEEDEDNQEVFPGLKVVKSDEASTLLVKLTLIHLDQTKNIFDTLRNVQPSHCEIGGTHKQRKQ